MDDFSKQTIKRLARKGIKLIGLQYLPDYSKPMPFANGETGYLMDDNGTGRVWTFNQVVEAAA